MLQCVAVHGPGHAAPQRGTPDRGVVTALLRDRLPIRADGALKVIDTGAHRIDPDRHILLREIFGPDDVNAAQVLSVLLEDRPGDIRISWEEIQSCGKGWVGRVQNGVSALGRFADPVLEEKIRALFKF